MVKTMIRAGVHAAALTVGCLLALTAQAQSADPQSWCKSKYGPDDQIGAANLLTPELALNAAKLVKTGKTYSLGAETELQLGDDTLRCLIRFPYSAKDNDEALGPGI